MESEQNKYCLGFMFDNCMARVALIRKKKPAWQFGRLNGIGGKVEDGEQGRDAMVREFREETGMETDLMSWHYFARMHSCEVCGPETWSVSCFASRGPVDELKTTTDEEIVILDLCQITQENTILIENIPWLVYAAIDSLTDNRPLFLDARYPS